MYLTSLHIKPYLYVLVVTIVQQFCFDVLKWIFVM
jgi:hypothetical protein